jgi:hypothetical protein
VPFIRKKVTIIYVQNNDRPGALWIPSLRDGQSNDPSDVPWFDVQAERTTSVELGNHLKDTLG